MVVRKTVFVKCNELNNNLKNVFQKLFLIKFLRNLLTFVPSILLFFELFYVFFLGRFLFIQIIKNIFFQFGLFLYYKLDFILPFLARPVIFFESTQLFEIFLDYITLLVLDCAHICFFIPLILKDTFNENALLYILLLLVEIFFNIVIICSNLFIWVMVLIGFLYSTESLSVFLEKLSKKLPNKSLMSFVFFLLEFVKALTATVLFILQNDINSFLLCSTKLKKVVFVSAKLCFYITWFFYARRAVTQF